MKYKPEKVEEICKYIVQGMSNKDAAILGDIDEKTFYNWMKDSSFSSKIAKSELECKQRNITIVQKAAINTWQAAAWWLERKYKDEFSLRHELLDENAKVQIDDLRNDLKKLIGK